jgi:hypothetical protein|tara:strand:- start:141 stop:317 length:177 start_codon:yes stop_codon:yes gene_type:complete
MFVPEEWILGEDVQSVDIEERYEQTVVDCQMLVVGCCIPRIEGSENFAEMMSFRAGGE